MTIDSKEWLRDKSITEVECLVSDISGIPRGKILPVHKYVSAIETGGLRLPEYVFIVNRPIRMRQNDPA